MKKPSSPNTRRSARPIKKKEEVQESNDEHIDQDFPGYPHHPSKDGIIKNGSGGAFEATEDIRDDEDDNDSNNRY